MKYLLLLLLLIGCGSRHAGIRKHQADTLFTVKIFVAFPDPTVKFDAIYRVTKDTVSAFVIDSTKTSYSDSTRPLWTYKIEQRRTRDTTYYIPISKTDTTRKDSTGKFIKVVEFTPTLKGSVYEGEDFMKGVRQLAEWIDSHKQYWPKPPGKLIPVAGGRSVKINPNCVPKSKPDSAGVYIDDQTISKKKPE